MQPVAVCCSAIKDEMPCSMAPQQMSLKEEKSLLPLFRGRDLLLHSHTWSLNWNTLHWVSFACYFCNVFFTADVKTHRIASHRRHPNTSYTSHHSSAVTKQHDHIKAEGREEPEREHVWVEEKEIKGCRQAVQRNEHDRAHTNPPPKKKQIQILSSSFRVEGGSTVCERKRP